MTILTRYVLRAHLGPFLFAFSAVTGLLFLNAVAQRVEDLAGRGLDLAVVGEFMLLSLPHIVALTLPMSLLVAVLYAFSELAGHNEIAAIAAGGIQPARFVAPLAVVGLFFTGLMFYFNDHVLPGANQRLSSLLADVASKSPTFQLREDVINPIYTGDDSRYFLLARSIDTRENVLEDVTIYDLADVTEARTIVAERARMSFTPDGRDLYMYLDEGTVFEVTDERPGAFQRLDYGSQILPFRGVGDELERQEVTSSANDREMDIDQLRGRVVSNVAEMGRMGEEGKRYSLEALETAFGITPPEGSLMLPPQEVELQEFSGDDVTSLVADMYRTSASRWEIRLGQNRSYLVELHKKYAISFACFIFMLLGPPLAVRFPQGGAGMVIAASVGIFFFYWMGLIGGERFANEGQMNPAVAMWAPNVILLVPALLLVARMGRQISTNRGSQWDALRFRVGELLGRGAR